MAPSVKLCSKCGQEKDCGSFYRKSERIDGLDSHCKSCVNTRSAAYKSTEAYRAKRPEYDAKYASTVGGKKVIAAAVCRWQKINPEKRAAHLMVGNAIASGLLERRPCEMCGDVRSHGHHHDYSKPLEVSWLCSKHHKAEHSRMPERDS
jgi:hypothetical protein